MPFLVRDMFEDLTDRLPMDEFLEKLAVTDGNGVVAFERKVRRSVAEQKRRYRILFLAGFVAAVANHFDSAANYLARASRLLRMHVGRQDTQRHDIEEIAVDRREIAYINAVVDRLRLNSREDCCKHRQRSGQFARRVI